MKWCATQVFCCLARTGKTQQQLPEVRKDKEGSTYVDAYPLVWNRFEQNGYVTAFNEESPDLAVFNLRYNQLVGMSVECWEILSQFSIV